MTARDTLTSFSDRVLQYIAINKPHLLKGIQLDLPEPQIIRALGEEAYIQAAEEAGFGVRVDLDTNPPNPSVASRLRADIARLHNALPHHEDAEGLYVVFGYPGSSSIEIVSQIVTSPIRVLIAPPSDVERKINEIYGLAAAPLLQPRAPSPAPAPARTPAATTPSTVSPPSAVQDPPIHEEGGMAAALLLHILREAVRMRVSDVHFLRKGTGEVQIMFRIDGILQPVPAVDNVFEEMRRSHREHEEADLGEHLIAHTMWLAKMDVADRTRPHDGAFARELQPGDSSSVVHARAAAIPSLYGYVMSIRLLPQEKDLRPLEEQGFSDRNLSALMQVARKKQGLFLVTGPTGSGKSTVIAALVDVIRKRGGLNIFSIEEPVEYRFSSGVTQIDLTRTPGVRFDGALRTALRMDPDVIVVGEIRDRETAKIASQAANTGHLVLSTLHTNNATVAVKRLQELGVEPHLLVDNLLGVLAQRLVPTLCPNCSVDAGAPDEVQFRALGYEHLLTLPEYQHARVRRKGPGCPYCNHTGYRGRVAIHELFLLTPTIRNAIAERASDERIRELAIREGMQTLREATLRRHLEGLVDLEAVVQIEMDVETDNPEVHE